MPQRPGVSARKPAKVIQLADRRGYVPPGFTRGAPPPQAQPRPILNAWGRVVGYTDPIGRPSALTQGTGPVAPRYIVGNLKGLGCDCDPPRRRRPGFAALGVDPPPVSPGVTISPELVVAEIQRLATEYDRLKPRTSFARWATDQGAGAIVDEFKAMLRATNDLQTLAAIEATPELSPEEKIAQYDAPLEGGPWALNEAGGWFQVVTPAPGSRVETVDGRQIYVPPMHPSVWPAVAACGAKADKRFLDQKFRATNRVTLQRDWKALFHKVAPRGWTSDAGGISGPRLFEGTPNDYDAEGGELYPDLEPGDAQGLKLWQWWADTSQNWCEPWAGLGPIPWLSVYTDADGYQRYKDATLADRVALNSDWRLARPELTCDTSQTTGEAQKFFQQNEGYKAQTNADGRRERDYSPYWAWAVVHPLNRCQVSSSKRRRKALKKAAAIAAIVVGAVFLGPMVAGAFKALAAKGAIAGKVLAAGKAAKAAKIAATAAKIIPKVIQGVNTVRTLKAVKDGEVPPPPIELTGTRFVDYASAIGTNLVEREMQEQGQEVAEAERQLINERMAAEIRVLQGEAVRSLPYPASQVPMYALPNVSPAMRDAMQAPAGDTWKLAAIAGGALLLGLMFSR